MKVVSVPIFWFVLGIISTAIVLTLVTLSVICFFIILFNSHKIRVEDNHCPEKLEPKMSEEKDDDHK